MKPALSDMDTTSPVSQNQKNFAKVYPGMSFVNENGNSSSVKQFGQVRQKFVVELAI
jgi:hypothetical protein